MSCISSGPFGAVALTLNNTCVTAEGYVQLAECHLLRTRVAGAAAVAALGNICQCDKGWKLFCRETA